MKLDHPFLQLPLAFDARALQREVEAIDPMAWRPHPQGYAGNDALALVSVDGDPDSDSVHGPMRATPHLMACPYLMQVLHTVGGVWGRSRLMRLQGQAEVAPHVDINYYWREHMRIHVPIVTQPTVRFVCDGQELNMAEGECWTFDTWRQHRVHNDDHRQRIHLVADTVGGPRFWEWMAGARSHDAERGAWTPRVVLPVAGVPALALESFNVPTVMSPWEARTHLEFLLDELEPGQAVDRIVDEVVRPFVRDWQALWAMYADSGRGLEVYRERRERLRTQLHAYEMLRLRNRVPLVKAIQAIVCANLVAQTAQVPPMRPASAPAAPSFTSLFKLGTTAQAWSASTPAPAARPPVRHTSPASASDAGRIGSGEVRFDKPLVVLSAPRSGSTLLFETLAQAPGLYTIGGESHRTFESLPGLHPSQRGFDSNRLLAHEATPEIVASLRANFAQALRDRDGRPPRASAVRLLEKTPKNSLRVPFLRAAFPDASYVVLYRRPHEVLASMIEAWQSGKFRTYPNLPGWSGPPWSLLLVPGWRELSGRPIEEIVARQWACTMDTLLDDLDELPADRVATVRYEAFLARPQQEAERICRLNGLGWDAQIGALPLSKTTLTPPRPDKWRKHEDAIGRVLPTIEPTVQRAERYFAPAREQHADGSAAA